ncbi:HvfC family RiPP maturation protein [Acinetobacter guerrae]|uniref:HvfC family RiPP maturation protein n=1 Tax=Acinetobacter guerrae TaxID=1843371 RepID=UPI00125FBBE0|nr:putative DNA-binding domain-containing protein [Acinetobacter guerrae]
MKETQGSVHLVQQQFCDWIRDPEKELPDVFVAKRMQVYRDLLFNNICSFINLVYPVAQALLPQQQWQTLLEEFFCKAQCQSPFYNDISLQFREYLENQQYSVLQQYPWLLELLHYEWLELYLDTVEIEPIVFTQDQDWQLTTTVWVLVYQYPVHQWTTTMTIDQIEIKPNALMVWRNADDMVCTETLSPLFAMLIEQMTKQPFSDLELSRLIKSVVPNFSPEQIEVQRNELRVLLKKLKLLYRPNKNEE